MNAPTQVHSVLIGLVGDTLLLPNAAVAEVLAREALRGAKEGPDWLAGHCDWNGRHLPVLRFERLNGGDGDGDPRRERLIVLATPGRHPSGGHLALLTQGYPHLVALGRAALRPAPLRESDRAQVVLARVRIANQEAVIPDLEQLEMQIAELG